MDPFWFDWTYITALWSFVLIYFIFSPYGLDFILLVSMQSSQSWLLSIPLPLQCFDFTNMFVYVQHLHAQIPKLRKRQSSYQYRFALLGSAWAKAACKMLVKSTSWRIRNKQIELSKVVICVLEGLHWVGIHKTSYANL